MRDKLGELFESNIPKIAQQVQLQLPKLKKVGEQKLPKLQLPKLKKVGEQTPELPKLKLPKLQKING
jgi:hypothetical protein